MKRGADDSYDEPDFNPRKVFSRAKAAADKVGSVVKTCCGTNSSITSSLESDTMDYEISAQSLEDPSDEYDFSHKKRGLAIVINQEHFLPSTMQKSRAGTEHDAKALCAMYEMLGFDVDRYDNLSSSKMLKVIQQAAKRDHSQYDCFSCSILSHGDTELMQNVHTGVVFGADAPIPLRSLTAPFQDARCPSLAGKPKIFFIQACRGTDLDAGVEVCDGGDEVDGGRVAEEPTNDIPLWKDYLIAYSTPPGYFSFRRGTGAWFIQSLTKMMKKFYDTTDLVTILTRTNRDVAFNYESKADKAYMSRKKQVPCFASQLVKDVFFRDKTKAKV